jgi:hypothetical protein
MFWRQTGADYNSFVEQTLGKFSDGAQLVSQRAAKS